MNKKFFDILPPDRIKTEKQESAAPEQAKAPLPKFVGWRKKKRFFLKSSIVLVFSFCLVLIFGFFLFPKAEIEISPKKFKITLEDEVTIDISAENYSPENKVMPAELFEDERMLERSFPSTGKATAAKKAKGTIIVYNEYSASPRTLIPSRFVSADGKLFWSTKTITIPGYKKQGTKIIPGEIKVEVEAAEPGDDYNIDPSTFALPALAGSALYTAIYAKSFSPMTGGFIGEVSSIAEQDLDDAEDALVSEAKNLSREALSARLPLGYILLDQTISQEIIETETLAEAGDLEDSFKYKATVKSRAFSFKKEHLDDFINNLIKQNIKSDENFLQDSLNITYSSRAVDLESGNLVLQVRAEAEVYKEINIEELKKALLGRTETEAKIFLDDLEAISSFKIKNKPFLKKTLPEEPQKVEVRINLD